MWQLLLLAVIAVCIYSQYSSVVTNCTSSSNERDTIHVRVIVYFVPCSNDKRTGRWVPFAQKQAYNHSSEKGDIIEHSK